MISARQNLDLVVLNAVNDAMLQIDSSRPAALKIELQGLGLSQSRQRIFGDVLKEFENLL
jgi:hypothetical protein